MRIIVIIILILATVYLNEQNDRLTSKHSTCDIVKKGMTDKQRTLTDSIKKLQKENAQLRNKISKAQK
jgi:hypothetical protein